MRRRSSSGFTLIELLVVIIVIGILAALLIPLFTHGKTHKSSASSLPTQRINNPAALKYIDSGLAQLKDPHEQLGFLTQQGCYASMAMIGVYGSLKDNPMMQRWNDINSRFIRIRSANPSAGPGSLTEAENNACPGVELP